jgi:hypothetical protein
MAMLMMCMIVCWLFNKLFSIGILNKFLFQYLPAEDKKADIREKMWNYMDKNQISPIYAPFGKIPNFKACKSFVIIVMVCCH